MTDPLPTREAPAADITNVEGVLERITYANEESAWSVVKIAVDGKRDPVTVVGNLLGVQPGESLRVVGAWVNDRKYGRQFRARSYTTLTPATIMGIRKYLGSGMVKGVGPVMADRLVEHFGLHTLDVIEGRSIPLAAGARPGPSRTPTKSGCRCRPCLALTRGCRHEATVGRGTRPGPTRQRR